MTGHHGGLGGFFDSGDSRQQPTGRKDAPPAFPDLERMYHLSGRPGLQTLFVGMLLLGSLLALLGLGADAGAFRLPPEAVAFLADKLPLGAALFAVGCLGAAACAVRDRCGYPSPAIMRREFVRSLSNQLFFPPNFDKSQFKVRVRHRGGHVYTVFFMSRIPGCSTEQELASYVRKASAAFGCEDTYVLARDERRGRGNRYRLHLAMGSPEEIWGKIGGAR